MIAQGRPLFTTLRLGVLPMVLSAASQLLGCSEPPSPPDPGRVTLHRLNRDEYNNTVRDLLGTNQRPADQFPADDVGFGFDNVAQVLSVSAPHVERYLRAAESLVDEVLRPDGFPLSTTLQVGEVEVRYRRRNHIFFASNSTIPVRIEVPSSASYYFSASAFGEQVPPDPAAMIFAVDGITVKTLAITAVESSPQLVQVEVPLSAGTHMVSFGFANDLYAPDPDPKKTLDRNLGLFWFRVHGPASASPENRLRKRVVVCSPSSADFSEWQACGDQILSRLARRAFRRPVTVEEVTELRSLAEEGWRTGDDFLGGLRPALMAILLSPRFLYRVELDRDPTSRLPHRLTDFELASRLSYFLWSSMPDDELLRVAEQSSLDEDQAVMRSQIGRMLDDPKAESLLLRFATQWLQLGGLDVAAPDGKRFPNWNEPLRADMKQETSRFVREFLPLSGSRELGLARLLTEPMTYLSPDLAKHYGVPGPSPDVPWEATSLLGTARRGLLTQGSVLTMTSYPGRTSPVKRGKWILEQLLCSPPPPPPPGVSTDLSMTMSSGSLRQRLEEHRRKPECAGCHRLMDPLGFGLEAFDAVGVFRQTDEGQPIDASGELPSGGTFTDNAGLAELIAQDPRFLRCAVRKLFTYAIGREPTESDEDRVVKLTAALTDSGGMVRQLITALVLSDAFYSRRGEPEEGAAP
jgi:hypothetical protein